MNAINDSLNRKILPRWRAFNTAVKEGELSPKSEKENSNSEKFVKDRNELAIAKEEWAINKSFSYAASLVTTAFLNDDYLSAQDAAEYVIKNSLGKFPLLNEVAERMLQQIRSNGAIKQATTKQCQTVLNFSRENWMKSVAHLKKSVRIYPYDAISWAELSFYYGALGQTSYAKRSMDAAMSLSPTNRYVLRSASRLLMHRDDYEKAFSLLSKSSILRSDPWILAAYISVGDVLDKSLNVGRIARGMLANTNFHPLQLSELAGAYGTREFFAGAIKEGRKYLRQSIDTPTENCIAQLYWMISKDFVKIDDYNFERGIYQSYEATTYYKSQSELWDEALRGAECWLGYQPVSKQPALYASYIAGTFLDDYEKCVEYAKFGLQANSNDRTLLNNLIFALLSQDKISEADKYVKLLDTDDAKDEGKISLCATMGLYNYRTGNSVDGKQKYIDAIEMATMKKNWKSRALAAIYLFREEARIKSVEAALWAETAEKYINEANANELRSILKRFVKKYHDEQN